jgi:hypothetical protein
MTILIGFEACRRALMHLGQTQRLADRIDRVQKLYIVRRDCFKKFAHIAD